MGDCKTDKKESPIGTSIDTKSVIKAGTQSFKRTCPFTCLYSQLYY